MVCLLLAVVQGSTLSAIVDTVENPELANVFVFAVVDPQGYKLMGTVERNDMMSFVAQFDDEERQRLATREVSINFEPLVVTVLEDTPLAQLHMFFLTNRLRYAFVTRQGVPVGLITREMLATELRRQHHMV